jgi:hypothetical protein
MNGTWLMRGELNTPFGVHKRYSNLLQSQRNADSVLILLTNQ